MHFLMPECRLLWGNGVMGWGRWPAAGVVNSIYIISYSPERELLADTVAFGIRNYPRCQFPLSADYPRTIRGTPKKLSAVNNGIVFTRKMHTFSRTIAGPPFWSTNGKCHINNAGDPTEAIRKSDTAPMRVKHNRKHEFGRTHRSNSLNLY